MDDYRHGHDVAAMRRPVLSRREVEVLLTWLRAESKEDAAATLFISASTVSTHLARIRAKYTAAGRPPRRRPICWLARSRTVTPASTSGEVYAPMSRAIDGQV